MKRMTKPKVSVSEAPPERSSAAEVDGNSKKLRVLVAGGGIGGLVFALAAKRKGFDVMVFEKDLSTIRGEGQYRGPIQIQSNALAALEAIDLEVADEVMKTGCITGDWINGLVDGISGNWYCKFDTFTPAAERGLPVTRVISPMTLQQILACAMGEDVIMNDSNVVNFEDDGDKVTVILENGQRYEDGSSGIHQASPQTHQQSSFGSHEMQPFNRVMTRTYPEDSGERKELILLQNIASYMLLACGAVYLISIEEDSH